MSSRNQVTWRQCIVTMLVCSSGTWSLLSIADDDKAAQTQMVKQEVDIEIFLAYFLNC